MYVKFDEELKHKPDEIGLQHEYRPEIDGLRAVAVTAVIAYHFNSSLLPSGFLGVDMFFVISGYVITTSLSSNARDNLKSFILNFYSRRMKRILPALLICIVVTCFFGSLFIDPLGQAFSETMKAGIFSLFGLSNLYFAQESVNYFGGSSQLNLFAHTWSLGVEEQFYFIFPLLFGITESIFDRSYARKILLTLLSTLVAISFILFIFSNKVTSSEAYFQMPPRFWEFGIGCVLALTSSLWLKREWQSINYLRWLSLASLVFVFFVPAEQLLLSTPAIVISVACLITTLRSSTLPYKLLTLRWVLFVGLISYSLYLWHWSILALSRWTIGIHMWFVPIQLIAILGLATLSFVFLERPFRSSNWPKSNLATINIYLFAIALTAAALFVLKRFDPFYVGTPIHFAGKGVETLLEDKWYAGKRVWRASDCILSSNKNVGKQIDTTACTIDSAGSSKRHFLVIGNSFSIAEFEMYSVLSENKLGKATIVSSWGASPVAEIPNDGPWSKANDYYWKKLVPELISSLTPGDIVIMINDVSSFSSLENKQTSDHQIELLHFGLKRLAEELNQKEVQIIFQSAIPFIREAGCTPDMASSQWFNIRNYSPCLYLTKAESLARIQPLQEMLLDLQSAQRNFHILDLFPVFCPQDVCKFFNDHEVFLYRDEWSHPSIAANYLTREIFLTTINLILSNSDDKLQE